MALDESWYTEADKENGSAFSLKVTRKLHEERSAYQQIEVYETQHFGKLLTIDGLVMLSDRDNFIYHEMMSHPALFTHAAPKKVLIIGGGDCGTLREVLKHPGVEEAWQVEIDERVTRVAERFFPDLCESNGDPRARFHFGDGIQWVADAEPESYDVIIVDSTDPVGPAQGLFSEPFYRDCRRALRAGGILVGQSESPLYHLPILRSMYQAMRAAGFIDVLTFQFPQCSYPSGWWSATMAGKDSPLSDFREEDAAQKPFPTRFYNAAMHRGAMATPEFLYEALTGS
jgi:spermidine synthase